MELAFKIAINNITQMLSVIPSALNGNRVSVKLVLSERFSEKMVSVLKLAIIAILGIS